LLLLMMSLFAMIKYFYIVCMSSFHDIILSEVSDQ
jgi:hypothetical protein